MARIALTWELGTGSGYVAAMAGIARRAIAQGHECVFIVRDLLVAAQHLPAELGELVQAPLGETPQHQQVKVQASYSSLLHNCGFASEPALSGRLRAWQSLYRRFAIDRVMVRHSPTALLAARLLRLPVLRYGQGFSEPPEQSPWPSFRPDLNIPDAVLRQNDAQLLQTINQALRACDAPPLQAVADLQRGTPVSLLTYAELDRYARTPETEYLGVPLISYGGEPMWPATAGPRLFVSMHTSQQLKLWLPLLAQLELSCLARVHAGSASDLPKHANIAISDEAAVDFERVAETCDAVLCYGSLNLVSVGLLKGKPVGVTAITADQLLMGIAVQKLGAGLLMSTTPDAGSPAMIERLVRDIGLRQTARKFAERYAGWSRDTIPQRLLDALLAAPPSGF